MLDPNKPEPLELAPKRPPPVAGVDAPNAGVEPPNRPLPRMDIGRTQPLS